MGRLYAATTRIVARAVPLLAALVLTSCPEQPLVPAEDAFEVRSAASVFVPFAAKAEPNASALLMPLAAKIERSTTPTSATPTIPDQLVVLSPAIADGADDDAVMRASWAPHRLEPLRPPSEQLLQQLEALEHDWGGVLGVYVYDLGTDQEVVGLHQDTVFSGASVLKAAIMLHAYTQLPGFTSEQADWLRQMIIDSDNRAANAVLAASAGGNSPNHAAQGAVGLSAMLASLGLQHTYLSTPYEVEDDPVDLSGIYVVPGPEPEGTPPYTVADPWLRATPAEISQVFLWIERCVQGRGPLLERFGATITPDRCREMIGLLEQNADRSRLVAGLPEGTLVAHKSGWIGDTQGDAGIVRSPGGDYLLAVFVYRDASTFDSYAAATTIAEASASVYRYFNQ